MEYRKLSRRDFMITAGAGLAALALPAGAGAAKPVNPGNPANLSLFTSIDGVYPGGPGETQMKFSYPWPEPSVEFGGLWFAFEIITFENAYAVDPARVTVTRGPDTLRFVASGYTWAGGQESAPGHLEAELRRMPDQSLQWQVAVRFGRDVKAVKTIVRGLPRGRLSVSAGRWQDTGDDEKIVEYPDLMSGMGTPLVAIEGKEQVWAISALQEQVRPARFYLQPGAHGYKAELLYEQAGWERRGEVRTHRWRIVAAAGFEAAVRPHFEHVERAYAIPRFETRADAPDWMRHTGLVLALHGQHWSGRIFNDYARQLEILRWASTRTDPRTTMVFLAGWDARYYWDYPAFEVDPRMGGEAGFRRLVEEGRKLGYRFLLMFGSNIVNPAAPGYAAIADARVRTVYGEPMASNYVDWDGDRKGEPSMVFMNLAVPSWRRHLAGRISAMVERYGVDAYFLDICGMWENNPDGDMFLGTRELVRGLAQRHPGVAAVAEMQYDAQMGIIPMAHVSRYAQYPQAHYDHVASFSHLSRPAPGSGATGVHEAGYGKYQPVTLEQREIPTITFAGDTWERHLALAEADIATANLRYARRGRRT